MAGLAVMNEVVMLMMPLEEKPDTVNCSTVPVVAPVYVAVAETPEKLDTTWKIN